MWAKYLIIVILFYFFAVLQNSFLAHFNIFGAVPNIVFIFFFLLIFFSARGGPAFGWEVVFFSLAGGFFLDIFSSSYFGASIIILLLIGILTKKIINSLKEKKDEYPIVYFIPLFLGFFMSYEIILRFSALNFSWAIFIEILYNLILAYLGFYIYKKITQSNKEK